MNTCRVLILSAGVAALLIGCSGGNVQQAPRNPVGQSATIQIFPSTAEVGPGGPIPFTGHAYGTADSGVTWTVVEAGGGTISASGLYTAPNATGAFHVVAAARSSPSSTATAIVVVGATPTVSVLLTPASVSLSTGQTFTFQATVLGSSDSAVSWSVQEGSGCGTIGSNGVYVAPATAMQCHVVATSQADNSKSASAFIAIAPPPAVPLGINVEGVTDWSAPFFADYVKQGRPWNVIGNLNAPVAVDASGWPTGDAEILIGTPPSMMARPQPYKLYFTGNASVSALSATVSNKVYNAATNTTTADVLVPGGVDPHQSGNFTLRFTGQAGGVKNVKLMAPGHVPAELFHQDFLARISYFSTLRFIAWLGPANSQVTSNTDREWADRGLPGYPIQTIDAPAWEYITLLANAAHKDVWIGIPYYASADYITKLAQLFKYGSDGVNPYTSAQANPLYPPLDPDRKVYIEYANEVWNSTYPTTNQIYAEAQTEVAAGDPHHLNYAATNQYYQGWRLYAARMVAISNAFRAVFGDADMMTRVRPILARQMANTSTFSDPLAYVNAVYGPANAYGNPQHPVNYYFYGMSGAIYIGNVEGATVDDIISGMSSYLTGSLQGQITSAKTVADQYGIKLVAYEGGQHLLPQTGSATPKLDAQMDPRMGDLIVQLYHFWFNSGGDLANYYTLCSGWGQYGFWGLSPDITSEATPKWTAVKTIAAGQ